jgi:hypothetical protein
MEWGRLYANLADDPRVQRAEHTDGAGWLLIESMCYCTSAETGGFIPYTQIERFPGGSRKPKKIAALVRETLWLPVEDGYLLNPDLWTEERNLSDSAEKKKEADRNRQRAKRAKEAAEKAAKNGDLSRDMSRDSSATRRATHDATDNATCRSDSRTVEKRREEIDSDVVSHRTVVVARQPDDDDHELVAEVVAAFAARTGQGLSDVDARVVAATVLGRAGDGGVTVHHVPRYVAAAIAAEPDPFGLLGEPPLLSEILAGFAPGMPVEPVRCGQCDQNRMREDPDGRPYRCPECHPGAVPAVGSG